VVGRNPELFNYFLPEKWRYKQVNLSHRRQTYYVQTKDRIHLVWEVSRLGELPERQQRTARRYEQLISYGFNSPFEEVSYALDLQQRVSDDLSRAVYMTGHDRRCQQHH